MNVNLLSQSTNFIDFAVSKVPSASLGWLETVIQWLIEGVGIVGLGIILFTVVLKTITLPLDVYSRVKMKKQSLVMKKMRPQMEKLQKQYANDKQMYNQKVMELQKESGVSIFGACLPMIITMVVFFWVFGAFSTYSQYANLSIYNGMVDNYNESVVTYVLIDLDGETVNEDGFLIAVKDESLGETGEKEKVKFGGKEYNLAGASYKVDFEAFEKKTGIKAEGTLEAEKMQKVREFVKDNARKRAADCYRDNRSDFIWVGNVWYPDSMLNKEVPDFSKFSSVITRVSGSQDTSYAESYDEVTKYLREGEYFKEGSKTLEGNTYNGYFVLIVLAIGLMFLQQFISMRSQKDANELSTVDGKGSMQNKMMLIMMPIIYGIFSFFYSAAFSLYMITSTLYGLITTVVINKIMEVSFAKQEANGGYGAKRKTKKTKRLK